MRCPPTRRWLAGAALALTVSRGAVIAQQVKHAPSCDSIIAAARVDSVPFSLFISVVRRDGDPLPATHAGILGTLIVSTFIPPRPFRLTVFSGPPRMRMLRPVGADTAPDLRAPTITGVYRAISTKDKGLQGVDVMRSSYMPGFDTSAVMAIRAVASSDRTLFAPPDDDDSMQVDVRLSTDSSAGARRFLTSRFPRMRVVDAVPLRSNPPPVFPELERVEGSTAGEVVLRFIVDQSGQPVPRTVEVVRESSLLFLRSALESLVKQRFTPATIGGCAIPQAIDYSFSFVLPPGGPRFR
jgi:hypothetical protein